LIPTGTNYHVFVVLRPDLITSAKKAKTYPTYEIIHIIPETLNLKLFFIANQKSFEGLNRSFTTIDWRVTQLQSGMKIMLNAGF